ncbi:LOW QUALITY PROTEIN: SH2 domain-containing protein 7-like [Parambassis ranga]|uniref:LOW QUALITY PROTEIN: SH2 domain-containing protein 7-like n=1 Tax=Parambassis ranga TaxID=210632 RepID=A0A6P7KCV3_9TELE|nr:LOW QUALITY PROTEIN: SH2 domain-containing protein 7-like [Parambassis ranga]
MSCVYISHVGSHSLRTLSVGDYRGSEVKRSSLMFAEMTPGSNHMLAISRKGVERNCCMLYRQQKPRPDKPKDQKHTKSLNFRSCLKFCFKDRARMEQRDAAGDPITEGTEGRLRELATKWFIDTQVPLIVNNGLFPAWFLGFIARKDAEEILREKEQGCFLVRLSDKAIGYILSYKGRDRCRHFVINQSEAGQFVVCGDTERHDTVPELIEYYKSSPIEPFGEYLTSSCFKALNEELYDIIQVSPRERPAPAVRDVKNTRKLQSLELQPTRPPKNNRTLEEVPPLPRRTRHLDSGTFNDHDKVLYAQLRKQSPRETQRAQHIFQDSSPAGRADRWTSRNQNFGRCSPPSGPDSAYSELSLLENKSRSLPLLDDRFDGEQSYRLAVPPDTPPRLSPKPIRPAASCNVSQSEKMDLCSRPSSSPVLDYTSDTAVYHLAGRPGSPHTTSLTLGQQSDSVYAEVPNEGCCFSDNTYELIPSHKETAKPKLNSNTYEPLEDIRPKHNTSSWGKNDKWKWLFPETKRK